MKIWSSLIAMALWPLLSFCLELMVNIVIVAPMGFKLIRAAWVLWKHKWECRRCCNDWFMMKVIHTSSYQVLLFKKYTWGYLFFIRFLLQTTRFLVFISTKSVFHKMILWCSIITYLYYLIFYCIPVFLHTQKSILDHYWLASFPFFYFTMIHRIHSSYISIFSYSSCRYFTLILIFIFMYIYIFFFFNFFSFSFLYIFSFDVVEYSKC